MVSSLLLLAACGDGTMEEGNTDVEPDETELTEEPEQVENPEETGNTAADSHLMDGLVDEMTFMDEYGLQAWEDYQAMIADVTYGEVTILNEENADYSTIEGTTSDEMTERIEGLDLREEVVNDIIEVSDIEYMTFYRYPAKEGSELSEVSDFLSEITLYYVEDQLMFSSITPGLYSVELNNLPSTDDLMRLLTIGEIEEIDPRVYTVSEMKINGSLIQQTMTPAMHMDEEGNEVIMAFYFFTHGEDILQYAYLPFEMVSQDFPTNSVLLYQQMIPEIQSLEL